MLSSAEVEMFLTFEGHETGGGNTLIDFQPEEAVQGGVEANTLSACGFGKRSTPISGFLV